MTLSQIINEMVNVFEKTDKEHTCDTIIDNIRDLVYAAEQKHVIFLFWCVGEKETFITSVGSIAADWCNNQPTHTDTYFITGDMANGFSFREA